ncbi:hypothetical protein ACI2IP_09610 [Microbacterium sp. NPDC090218]
MSAIDRDAAVRDLQVQQLRILSLVHSVAELPSTAGKVDSLTKLAKLDFLVRYPEARDAVRGTLAGHASRRVDLNPSSGWSSMVRHKFGPWDDSYYPVIGALVARGLARYVRAKNRAVGVSLTKTGNDLYRKLREDEAWDEVAAEVETVASEFGHLTGNKLKDAIYTALPHALDVPHRTELHQ